MEVHKWIEYFASAFSMDDDVKDGDKSGMATGDESMEKEGRTPENSKCSRHSRRGARYKLHPRIQ